MTGERLRGDPPGSDPQSSDPQSSDYDVRSSRTVWEGMLSTARVDEVAMPSGGVATREVVAHIDAVAVVALTEADEIVLLRQYRHPLARYLLELPAGLLDVEDEAPDDAARRELAEETGMEAPTVRRVLTFANSAGWTDEQTTVYLAEGVRPGDRPEDFRLEHEEADMDVLTMPLDEAVAGVLDGRITDAKTIIGILAVAAARR